jgi:hypothetical protein
MAGIAVTAGLMVPLAVVGAPALAGSNSAAGEYGSGSSQYQYQSRVTICHLTGSKKHPARTITVSSKSVAAHVRHGDHLGACTATEKAKPKHVKTQKTTTATTAPTTAAPTTSAPVHGKGHKK